MSALQSCRNDALLPASPSSPTPYPYLAHIARIDQKLEGFRASGQQDLDSLRRAGEKRFNAVEERMGELEKERKSDKGCAVTYFFFKSIVSQRVMNELENGKDTESAYLGALAILESNKSSIHGGSILPPVKLCAWLSKKILEVDCWFWYGKKKFPKDFESHRTELSLLQPHRTAPIDVFARYLGRFDKLSKLRELKKEAEVMSSRKATVVSALIAIRIIELEKKSLDIVSTKTEARRLSERKAYLHLAALYWRLASSCEQEKATLISAALSLTVDFRAVFAKDFEALMKGNILLEPFRMELKAIKDHLDANKPASPPINPVGKPRGTIVDLKDIEVDPAYLTPLPQSDWA